MKFILNVSSRITFLLILISKVCGNQVTVFTVNEAETGGDVLEHIYVKYKTHSTSVPGLIFLWILGKLFITKCQVQVTTFWPSYIRGAEFSFFYGLVAVLSSNKLIHIQTVRVQFMELDVKLKLII